MSGGADDDSAGSTGTTESGERAPRDPETMGYDPTAEEEDDIDVEIPQASGGTGASTATPYKPKEPKFGGITKTSTDTYQPWTGGKPKADWTELETKKPLAIQPTQYRPTSITSQAKGQYYRTQGLEPKFGREGDIQAFQREKRRA